ncbi:Uridylate kinase PyrH [Mycobacteroides abscessus]|nr:Uridylate kinase PyrH [Mycobacteroides abscessus]
MTRDVSRTGYKRVLLKLGGEMFGGGAVGLDPDVVHRVARQIAEVVRTGAEVAVVIGGGNFFRGAQLQQRAWSAPGRTTWACSEP